MCGLVAVLDRRRRPNREAVDRGLDAIAHRGPDSASTWQSPGGEIVLGHKRLSLVDLATGDQPVVNETGTIHAIVNGEFYGFEAIRADLESRGHRFRSKSDSEILIHLYEDHGTACVHHLRGEYAFVLWDETDQSLFAGRDRFGIKPLFYAHIDGRLSFASEVKALHATGVSPAWDERAFLQTLTIGSTVTRSLFRDVTSLAPGCHLVEKAGAVTIRRYWDFDFLPEHDIAPRSDADYAEEFLAMFDDAVRVRMRADVPIGCYLSGGLDSCSILALMSKHAGTPIQAFTLGFDHPGYDETALAREMARHAGADLTLVPVDQAALAASFSDSVWHAEKFFFNAHGVGKYLLSAAVHDAGYKAVLTGEGADEILAGYAHFRLDALRRAGGDTARTSEKALVDANEVSQILLMTSASAAPVPSLADRLGYTPAFTEPWRVNCQRMAGILPPGFDPSEEYASWLEEMDVAGQMTGRDVVNQSLYLWNETALPGYMLTILGDRMEMAHSIEGRLPFLDHHLVEFTRSLPVSQKIKGNTEKFVLREAMRPVLPAAVSGRQKHPFTAPPTLLDPDGPFYGMVRDVLSGPSLAGLPCLDTRALRKTLDRLPDMDPAERITWEVPLTAIFSGCLLAEQFRL